MALGASWGLPRPLAEPWFGGALGRGVWASGALAWRGAWVGPRPLPGQGPCQAKSPGGQAGQGPCRAKGLAGSRALPGQGGPRAYLAQGPLPPEPCGAQSAWALVGPWCGRALGPAQKLLVRGPLAWQPLKGPKRPGPFIPLAWGPWPVGGSAWAGPQNRKGPKALGQGPWPGGPLARGGGGHLVRARPEREPQNPSTNPKNHEIEQPACLDPSPASWSRNPATRDQGAPGKGARQTLNPKP